MSTSGCSHCHQFNNSIKAYLLGCIDSVEHIALTDVEIPAALKDGLHRERDSIAHSLDNLGFNFIHGNILNVRRYITELLTHFADREHIVNYLARINGALSYEDSEWRKLLDTECNCSTTLSRPGPHGITNHYNHGTCFSVFTYDPPTASNLFSTHPLKDCENFNLAYSMTICIEAALPDALRRMYINQEGISSFKTAEREIISFMDSQALALTSANKGKIMERIIESKRDGRFRWHLSDIVDSIEREVIRVQYIGIPRDFIYFSRVDPTHCGNYYLHHTNCLHCDLLIPHCYFSGACCSKNVNCYPHKALDIERYTDTNDFLAGSYMFKYLTHKTWFKIYEILLLQNDGYCAVHFKDFYEYFTKLFALMGIGNEKTLCFSNNLFNAVDYESGLFKPVSLKPDYDETEVVAVARKIDKMYPELKPVSLFLALMLTSNFRLASIYIANYENDEVVEQIFQKPEDLEKYSQSQSLICYLIQNYIFEKFRLGISFEILVMLEHCIEEYKSIMNDDYDSHFKILEDAFNEQLHITGDDDTGSEQE